MSSSMVEPKSWANITIVYSSFKSQKQRARLPSGTWCRQLSLRSISFLKLAEHSIQFPGVIGPGSSRYLVDLGHSEFKPFPAIDLVTTGIQMHVGTWHPVPVSWLQTIARRSAASSQTAKKDPGHFSIQLLVNFLLHMICEPQP